MLAIGLAGAFAPGGPARPAAAQVRPQPA